MLKELQDLTQDLRTSFEVESLQVSYSHRYPIIVRAYAQMEFEGETHRFLRMLRVSNHGALEGSTEPVG